MKKLNFTTVSKKKRRLYNHNLRHLRAYRYQGVGNVAL
jgi:hypothetical protein